MPKRSGGPDNPRRPRRVIVDTPRTTEGVVPLFRSISDLQEKASELQNILKRFALKRTRNEEEANDLVQDTFVRALERRGQFQEGTSLLSWMTRIAQNIHIDRMRTAKVSTWLHEPFDVSEYVPNEPATHSPAHQEVHMELVELDKIIATLSPDQQELITFLAEECTYQEMAETLGIPLGTVMSRLHRMRVIIRERAHRS